jgi:gluconate 2-dehydrogenase alpha chain
MGAGGLGMTLDDLGSDNFDHHGLGFLGGGAIFCQQTGGRPIQQGTATPKGTPKWGPQWKAALKQWYGKSWNVVMEGESPSYRTHSLDLDPTYRDAYGDPLLRICFDWTDNERKLVAYTAKKIEALFKAAGATMYNLTSTLPKHYDTVAYQSTHNVGGAIMGGDPHTSVVNNYSQMWDYDNVFVVGASSFPQNASFNPTDTVGALALRCADGITKRYKNRPGPLA